MWSLVTNPALMFPLPTDVFAFTVEVMNVTPTIVCWNTTVVVGLV